MNTSEVLNKAADHIQQYGHRKRGLGSQGEPTCALGAVMVISGRAVSPASLALSRYLGGVMVHEWNNAPDRTAAEVIETLRAAALIEAAKETAETRQAVSAS